MRKILLINYYFPPSGGPAVQRWLSLIRHLLDNQLLCYVISPDPQYATYPLLDLSLLEQIPAEVSVFRTRSAELFNFYKKWIGKGKVPANNLADEPNPTFLQKIARFVRGNFFLPDPRRAWNKFAYEKAKEIIEKEKIELIVTAGPPHSTHLVGRKLQENLGVRWIADLHDYWTDISYLDKFYRTRWANWIDRKYERQTLENADLILTHCQFSKKLFAQKTEKPISEKIHVHTMGYEERLFPEQKPIPQTEFVITFAGIMPEFYEPACFFEAVKLVLQKFPDLPLRLCFVGLLSPIVRKQISEYGLEKYLQETAYVEHQRSIQYLYESTMLFLINPRFKNEKMHVPGKIYEYLAVRKPILSFAPADSENAYLVGLCEAGQNFERHEIQKAAIFLAEMVEKWLENPNLDLDSLNQQYLQFGRKAEAAKLAEKIKKMF